MVWSPCSVAGERTCSPSFLYRISSLLDTSSNFRLQAKQEQCLKLCRKDAQHSGKRAIMWRQRQNSAGKILRHRWPALWIRIGINFKQMNKVDKEKLFSKKLQIAVQNTEIYWHIWHLVEEREKNCKVAMLCLNVKKSWFSNVRYRYLIPYVINNEMDHFKMYIHLRKIVLQL